MVSDLDDLLGRWVGGATDEDQDFLQVAIGIILLSQIVGRDFQKMVNDKVDMGAGDVRILLSLRRAENFELRPTDLFKRLLITSGAVSKQVDRLAEKGLVVRVPNANEKRSQLVRLTPKGKTLADNILTSKGEEFGAAWVAFRNLPPQEQSRGVKFVRALLEQLTHELPGKS